jgi:hypothetical protein
LEAEWSWPEKVSQTGGISELADDTKEDLLPYPPYSFRPAIVERRQIQGYELAVRFCCLL